MSKAILEFNLPEEQEDFELAFNGHKWQNVCWRLDQWLRGNIKHAPDSISEDEYQVYEQCREELRNLVSERGLSYE